MTNAKGALTSFQYDPLRRLTKVLYPDGTTEQIAYDAVGNPVASTDGEGRLTRRTFDAGGRLLKTDSPDGTVVSQGFDAVGNRTSLTDARGTTFFYQDPLNREVSVSLPDGKSLSRTFDATGNRTSLHTYAGKTLHARYDEARQLIEVVLPSREAVQVDRDLAGNVTKITYPNGVQQLRTYDSLNRVKSITTKRGGELLSSFTYTRDVTGNITQIQEGDKAHQHRFAYDPLSRLIKHVDPSGQETEWAYDGVGNRVSQVEKPASRKHTCNRKRCVWREEKGSPPDENEKRKRRWDYTYDEADKLLEILERPGHKTTRLEYDRNGNLIKTIETKRDDQEHGGPQAGAAGSSRSKVHTTGYGWDPRNLLQKVILPNGKTLKYLWDGDGLRYRSEEYVPAEERRHEGEHKRDDKDNHARRGKSLSASSSSGKPLLVQAMVHRYDGSALIEDERLRGHEEKGFLSEYVYGEALLAMLLKEKAFFYHADQLGSITEITDEDGELFKQYRYAPFGAMVRGDKSSKINPFRFVGAYGVRWEPQGELYHMGWRFYDQETGRFISRDPVRGFVQDPHTLNRYNYALANPVNRIDPLGLFSTCIAMTNNAVCFIGTWWCPYLCTIVPPRPPFVWIFMLPAGSPGPCPGVIPYLPIPWP